MKTYNLWITIDGRKERIESSSIDHLKEKANERYKTLPEMDRWQITTQPNRPEIWKFEKDDKNVMYITES